jgi:hypothetical protein
MVAAVLLTAAPLAQSDNSETRSPRMPHLEWGACPREYCTYGKWTARRATVVRTDRRRDAPIAFRLYRGDEILALTGVVATLKPGLAVFSRNTVLTNLVDGYQSENVRFQRGDRIFILRFQLESRIAVWFKGKTLDFLDGDDLRRDTCSNGPTPRPCVVRLVSVPVTEWWAQLQRPDGVIGWSRDMDAFDR